jgi:hypothetical protein
MPTVLEHALHVCFPRLTTHCSAIPPLACAGVASQGGANAQEAVGAHLLATRRAGWRVPASTMADAPLL